MYTVCFLWCLHQLINYGFPTATASTVMASSVAPQVTFWAFMMRCHLRCRMMCKASWEATPRRPWFPPRAQRNPSPQGGMHLGRICWDMLGSSVGFDKLFLPIKRMRILQQFNSLLLLRIFHVDIMRDVYIHVPEYSLSRKSSSKTSELQTNVQGQFRHVHHITSLARAVYVWEMWGQ